MISDWKVNFPPRLFPRPSERALVVKLHVAKDVGDALEQGVPQAMSIAFSFLGLDGIPVFVNPWLEPGDAFAEMSDGGMQRIMKRVA